MGTIYKFVDINNFSISNKSSSHGIHKYVIGENIDIPGKNGEIFGFSFYKKKELANNYKHMYKNYKLIEATYKNEDVVFDNKGIIRVKKCYIYSLND